MLLLVDGVGVIAEPVLRSLPQPQFVRLSGPYFKLELAIAIDHLEIGAIGGNQASAVGSGREGDQHIEIHVAKFVWGKSFFCADLRQQLSRLQPIPRCRSENGMIALQGPQEFLLRQPGRESACS